MPIRRPTLWQLLILAALAAGCGTTRWSDTARTATEQLLMSDAIERSISQIDFSPLAGRDVYLDGKYIAGLVDEKYVTSTLRQHLFASGCIVKDRADESTCVVEVRAGALGTNRNDLLLGIPATNLPAGGGMLPLVPTSIPELSLMKKTAQLGVCKVSVFAYDRASGHPIWQSGVRQQVSKAKDVWVFGTGPFQRGTIYDGTKFAGERLQVPLAGDGKAGSNNRDKIWVTHEILFHEPPQVAGVPPMRTPSVAGGDAPAAGGTADTLPAGASPAAASGGAVAAQAGTSSGTQSASGTPNAAAGAFGAVQAVDWARSVRQNYSAAR